MSCLLRCLLFDVFYGLYSRGVSVFTDVASCLSFFYGFLLFAVDLFFARLFYCLLILLGSPRVYMVIFILIYVLPRINVSLFFACVCCVCVRVPEEVYKHMYQDKRMIVLVAMVMVTSV